MVGDRRFPGAAILGDRDHLPPLPTITCQSRRQGLVLRDGLSSGQCTRWRASRGVSCCGNHYPLPRRCGDVTFFRFVTPLRVRDSFVWLAHPTRPYRFYAIFFDGLLQRTVREARRQCTTVECHPHSSNGTPNPDVDRLPRSLRSRQDSDKSLLETKALRACWEVSFRSCP